MAHKTHDNAELAHLRNHSDQLALLDRSEDAQAFLAVLQVTCTLVRESLDKAAGAVPVALQIVGLSLQVG